MEPNTNEATAPKRLKTGGRKPLIIIGIVLAVLAVLAGAAYLACCYLGTYSDTFAPRYTINGVNVGGLTVEQASEKIWEEYQQRTHMVVEGAAAAKSVAELARRLGVDAPITFALEAVLWRGVSKETVFQELIDRFPTEEFYGLND